MPLEDLWRRCCKGKKRFGSLAAAVAAANRPRKDRLKARGLGAYKCPFGNHWHIGHDKRRARKKKP
jgi:hypothetical protein